VPKNENAMKDFFVMIHNTVVCDQMVLFRAHKRVIYSVINSVRIIAIAEIENVEKR